MTTGQTGSGKSHSMVGDVAAPGLIPRFTDALFTVAQRAAAAGAGTYTVEVSLAALVAARLRVTAHGDACDGTHKNCSTASTSVR
jgi:Kinesin motor domain